MLVLLASLAHAAAPTVDLAEEADLLFRRGVEAYRDGEVEDALERLLASERLVPNRNVTFNIARCYETLGALDQAWRHYAAYAAAEPDPAARAEADQALARLDGAVARVAVETEPPGATIYVERRDLGTRGTTPLVLALPPGEHTILVDRDGFATATGAARLVRGQLATVALRLGPLAEDPAPAPVSTVPPVEARWTGTVVAVGGVVLAAVGPGDCALLPGRVEGAGRPVDGPEPLLAAGSALQAAGPATGLTVDTTIDGHPARARLARVDKRALALADASPLHATLFARCAPTDPGGLAAAVGALPGPVRPDAVAVLAEWAAWRGASDVPAIAARCSAGDCGPLVAALVR